MGMWAANDRPLEDTRDEGGKAEERGREGRERRGIKQPVSISLGQQSGLL